MTTDRETKRRNNCWWMLSSASSAVKINTTTATGPKITPNNNVVNVIKDKILRTTIFLFQWLHTFFFNVCVCLCVGLIFISCDLVSVYDYDSGDINSQNCIVYSTTTIECLFAFSNSVLLYLPYFPCLSTDSVYDEFFAYIFIYRCVLKWMHRCKLIKIYTTTKVKNWCC